MATVVCINVPPLPDKLLISLPGVGELQFIKDTLDGIDRPSDYVLKALNSLSPALAPIWSMIRILDALLAVQACITAIPKAIPFNPSAIIDCFKRLLEAFANLLPLIPPLSYVRMIVDIVVALRYLVDDVLQVIVLIDAQVTRVKQTLATAVELNDTALLAIGQCAQEDLKPQTAGLLQIVEFVHKVIYALLGMLDIIAYALPPPVADKVKEFKDDVTEGLAGLPGTAALGDFPALGAMMDAFVIVRDILGMVEQLGKAILGMPFTFTVPELPELQNP